ENGALPRPVVADYADALAFAYVQRHVPQSPHFHDRIHRLAVHLPDEKLLERHPAALADVKGETDVIEVDICHAKAAQLLVVAHVGRARLLPSLIPRLGRSLALPK